MAWKTAEGTKHTCGGPKFGKLADGCPRCEELKAGAPSRSWGGSLKRQNEARQSEAIRVHDCRLSHCGVVCTFGEW